MNAQGYINALNRALKHEGAHTLYFPSDTAERKAGNLRLGREFGFGLGPFANWLDCAQSTYGQFVVANSLDRTGVVIDAKEWLAAVHEGVERYNSTEQ